MYDSSKLRKNQTNPKQYKSEVPTTIASSDVTFSGSEQPNLEYRDLTSSEPAPIRTWVANPFDQLHQMEDCIYDNAPPEIKDLISDATDKYFESPTIDHLEQTTSRLKHNQLSYVRDAIDYYHLKTLKLYKAKYRSLNEYAQVELGMTASRCDQIINSGMVTLKLIAAGHTKLPRNSAQAYALHGLNDEKLVHTWEDIISSHAMHEITADKIKAFAYPPEPSKVLKGTSVNLNPLIYEQLVVNACKLKITIGDYISHLLKLQKCKFSLLLNLARFQT